MLGKAYTTSTSKYSLEDIPIQLLNRFSTHEYYTNSEKASQCDKENSITNSVPTRADHKMFSKSYFKMRNFLTLITQSGKRSS